MKYSSPTRVALLSFLTLGLYDFYWFATTNRELAKATGVRLRSSVWQLLFGLVRVVSVMIIVWSVYQQILLEETTPDYQLPVLGLLGMVVLANIVTGVFVTKWIVPYVEAAQAVTKNKLNASNIVLMLYFFGLSALLVLQQAYNNPGSVPGVIGRDLYKESVPKIRVPERPIIKRTLAIIAISMVIGLMLLILFPIVVGRIS